MIFFQTQPMLTYCDVITCNNSHLNHGVTCLATMSSLMRTKSTRWSAAMPNTLWMLCKSAAMSGSVEDSVQRWLQRGHRHTSTSSRTISTLRHVLGPLRVACLNVLVLHLPYVPTQDSEHFASVVVRIQDFSFCCLC